MKDETKEILINVSNEIESLMIQLPYFNNITACVVGGAVVDYIHNVPHKDIDIAILGFDNKDLDELNNMPLAFLLEGIIDEEESDVKLVEVYSSYEGSPDNDRLALVIKLSYQGEDIDVILCKSCPTTCEEAVSAYDLFINMYYIYKGVVTEYKTDLSLKVNPPLEWNPCNTGVSPSRVDRMHTKFKSLGYTFDDSVLSQILVDAPKITTPKCTFP